MVDLLLQLIILLFDGLVSVTIITTIALIAVLVHILRENRESYKQ